MTLICRPLVKLSGPCILLWHLMMLATKYHKPFGQHTSALSGQFFSVSRCSAYIRSNQLPFHRTNSSLHTTFAFTTEHTLLVLCPEDKRHHAQVLLNFKECIVFSENLFGVFFSGNTVAERLSFNQFPRPFNTAASALENMAQAPLLITMESRVHTL